MATISAPAASADTQRLTDVCVRCRVLSEKKLSKEEKKAQAEAKKAERDAKKAAKKGDGEGDGDTIDISEAGDEYAANGDEASSSSSDAKTKKAASKGSKKKDKGAQEDEAVGGDSLLQIDEGTLKFAVCTGNLASRKDSKDVKIQAFSISLFGKVLFEDQTLELTWGHRYGLVGQNGSGKTTFLKCIASRQIVSRRRCRRAHPPAAAPGHSRPCRGCSHADARVCALVDCAAHPRVH